MPIRGDQLLAAAVLDEVTQAAHGFTLRQMLGHNGTDWVLANAGTEATRARGLVAEVIDANTFIIAFGGLYDEDAAHGLTLGADYYLDDVVSGGITLSQEGIVQHVLTVVSTTGYLVKMYDPVKPAYIFDRRAGTTYYGYVREDDQRWLIKFLVIAPNGGVDESYANILNNGGYATLDLAWPDRAILTYDPDQAVAERKPFFGGVTGPVGATDGNVALFDGISGRVLKEGPAPLLDAPSDGMTYGRMNASWSIVSGGSGAPQIEETYTGEAASLAIDTLFTFILTRRPRHVDAVRLYVNGALQRNGLDFSVGGLDDKRVTWLGLSGTADFTIQGTDHITVAYEPI